MKSTTVSRITETAVNERSLIENQGILRTMPLAQFLADVAPALKESQCMNVRGEADYAFEKLKPLFESLESSGGNTQPLQIVLCKGKYALKTGNRRFACLTNKFAVNSGTEEKPAWKDYSLPETLAVSYIYEGEMSERDLLISQLDQVTFLALSKESKFDSVNRLVNFGLSETEIMAKTGLTKGSVQTPRKFVIMAEFSGLGTAMLRDAYLDGTITGDDINRLSKDVYNAKGVCDAEKKARLVESFDKIISGAETKAKPRSWKAIRETIYPIVAERYQKFLDLLADDTKPFDASEWK